MAHLRRDEKSGVFFIRFRYNGRSVNRSLKTKDKSEADAVSGRIRETILLLERGRLEMPSDADPAAFILSDGKRLGKEAKPKVGTLAELFQTYTAEMPEGYRACEGHTHERNHPNVTIQTCWDSDRLDLGRVGITPHPTRLCTEVARRPETIKWADGRASFGVVPTFILEDWGIDMEKERGW